MTTTINAGGGDYQGLPTTPIEYRGARKPEGLPWAELTEQYVASGGQVDASVWPKVNGKVVTIGQQGNSRHRVHTWVEAEGNDRDNTLAQGAPAKQPTSRALLSADDQRKVALKYRRGASIRELGQSLGVSITAIHTALKKQGEPTRTRSEAQQMRAGRTD